MTRQLLVFFLILSCELNVHAQGRVHPFEDYTKCYIGFLKDRKDTLWPAQFESAVAAITVHNNLDCEAWIVKFQGYYGMIDRTGKITIPFMYDALHPTFDKHAFIAVKNEKAGIISSKGEVITPLIYDQVLPHVGNFENFYYKVIANDLVGIVNAQFALICPTIYPEIELYDWSNSYSYDKKQELYFLVQDSLHVGLMDFHGKLRFPVEYDGFRDLEFDDLCGHVMNFWEVYRENKVGIYNDQFEELTPPVWQNIQVHSTLGDSCGAQIRHFAILSNDENYVVTDLESGKKSKQYDFIENAGSFHIVRSNKWFGVLDEQLNELPIRTKKEIALFSDQGSLYTAYRFEERETGVVTFVMDKEVIALKEPEKRTKRGHYTRAQYGFYNYKTHEQIEPMFDAVYRKTLNDESYFWAFNFTGQGSEKGMLTIYNSKLQIIHKYDFSDYTESTMDFFFFCHGKEDRVLLIADRKGNYGGINAKGEVIIPFDYTTYEEIRSDPYYSCKVDSWIVTKGTKKGIYSPVGKLLLPVEYEEIDSRLKTFYAVRNGAQYGVLDSNFRILIDGCSSLIVSSPTGLEYKFLHVREHYEALGEQLYFAVKNDSLYALQEMRFKKVEGPMINAATELTIVGYQILINKEGRVIQTGYKVERITPNLYAVQRQDTLWLYNAMGNLLNKIGGVAHFNRQTEWLQISGKKNTYGAADLQTGKVLLEPVWASITPFYQDGKQAKDMFWVQQMPAVHGAQEAWLLMNTAKERVVDQVFDYPLFFDRAEPMVFRSSSLFGMIDKDMQVLVPANCSQIRQLGKYYFLQRGTWSVYSPEKGIIDLNAYSIATDVHPKGYVLFGYESVGILGQNLEWILPMTSITTARDSLNLASILGITGYDSWLGRRNTFFIPDTNARLLNNRFILELAETRSTRYSYVVGRISNWNRNPYFSAHPDELRDLEITVRHSNAKIVSVTRKRESILWNEFAGRRYELDRWTKTTIEHTTYTRSGSIYAEITLKDLFVEGSNYAKVIDDLLTSYINKRQLFGVNCVNLPKILDDYKKSFYLLKDSIVFCQPHSESNAIAIRYADLKTVMKKGVVGE